MLGPSGTLRHNQRVLIVAHDEDTSSMLTFLLRAEGFNVYCLADRQRARTLLRLCRGPVTVILDDSVPDADLAQWLEQLAETHLATGILLRRRFDILPFDLRRRLSPVSGTVVRKPLQIAALVDAVVDANPSLPARARRPGTLPAGEHSAGQPGRGAAPAT